MIASAPASEEYDVALIRVALGDWDSAFQTLDRVWESRNPNLSLNMRTDPKLDPIGSDPRFANLIHRIGLEPW